jgi:GTPase involved in cell partitioning and DNA repair
MIYVNCQYDKSLLEREEVVVLSKIDTVDKDEVKKKIKALEKASKNKNVIALSLYEDVKCL